MKKIFIFCLFIFISNITYGQKKGPSMGDWSLTTSASPIFNYLGNVFSGTSIAPEVNFQNEQFSLYGKLFTSDSCAWRGGINVLMISNKMELLLNEVPYISKESSFSLNLSLGKEFRKGKNRIQGFYGYESNIMINTSSYNDGISLGEQESSMFGFGMRGFIGVEYFFKRKMSLGAEYQHGISYRSNNTENSFEISGQTTEIYLNLYF